LDDDHVFGVNVDMKSMTFQWLKFIVSLSALVAINPSARVYASDSFGCETVLMSDKPLLESLPPRLREIFESGRMIRMIRKREDAWGPLHQAMDEGFKNGEKPFTGQIQDLQIRMSFKRTNTENPELWIEYLARDGLKVGENSVNGMRFLDFIAAQMDWIAKARAANRISKIEIIGENLQNQTLIKLLRSTGFTSRGKALRECGKFGLIGGSIFGAAFGFLFIDEQDELLVASSTGAVVGGVSLAATICITKQGGNFGLKVKP
jgi:hypothetical protein